VAPAWVPENPDESERELEQALALATKKTQSKIPEDAGELSHRCLDLCGKFWKGVKGNRL